MSIPHDPVECTCGSRTWQLFQNVDGHVSGRCNQCRRVVFIGELNQQSQGEPSVSFFVQRETRECDIFLSDIPRGVDPSSMLTEKVIKI